MKIYSMLIVLLVTFQLLNCSSSVQMVPEPVEQKDLLIGSLIFDIDGYQDNFQTIFKNIEVAIIGRYVQDGQLKNFGHWVTTDENGYFYIANVPDGEYAIKGFRVQLIGLGNIGIENELDDPEQNYYELSDEEMIGFSGELLDTRSHQRIVNFKHNIFTLHRTRIVDHKRFDRLQNIKLSTGEVLNDPPVPVYFMERFEGSGWADLLNSLL